MSRPKKFKWPAFHHHILASDFRPPFTCSIRCSEPILGRLTLIQAGAMLQSIPEV
jgi:hypothetical protein